MKKILPALAITVVFAACGSNPNTNSASVNPIITADTATLNHNAFTDKAQEVQLNGVNDTIVTNDGNTYVKVKPKETPMISEPVAKSENVKKAPIKKSSATAKSRTTTVAKTTSPGNTETSSPTATTSTPVVKRPKWSKAAKGAVIGAGTGAAAGAIISKKKGKGAIIGGVLGGAGGYIIGRTKDKKDGRY